MIPKLKLLQELFRARLLVQTDALGEKEKGLRHEPCCKAVERLF